MAAETWRPVVGYETEYLVSDLGNVYSIPRLVYVPNIGQRRFGGHALSPNWSGFSRDYLQVRIDNRWHYVHRMVAMAFIGPIPADYHVCHNNNDTRDNRAVNLRISTRASNYADKLANGSISRGAPCLCADIVREIKRKLAAGLTGYALAREYNVTPASISNIKTGRHWSHVKI